VTDLEALKAYATPEQVAAIDALVAHGSYAAASEATGKPAPSLRRLVGKAKKRAAKQGYAPDHDMTKVAAPGFAVKGTSTLYDAKTGEAKIQWVRTQRDREDEYEAWREAIADLCEPLRGTAKPVAVPRFVDSDLANVVVAGDPHFGQYSWHEETGDNYDLNIAESLHLRAAERLLAIAPEADTAVIVNLGDELHGDSHNSFGRTPQHGHILDVDGRFSRALSVVLRTFRRMIDMALEKHQRVRFVSCIGNHSPTASIAITQAFAMLYENEPRVEIDTSPSHFRAWLFGSTLLGFCHGDKSSFDKLPGILAADHAQAWAQATTRRILVGHVHHTSVREYAGCTVETFRTLAAKDAYATAGGWRSQRSMDLVTYHRKFGEVNRCRVGVEQIGDDNA
jgi:hypothetical protein